MLSSADPELGFEMCHIDLASIELATHDQARNASAYMSRRWAVPKNMGDDPVPATTYRRATRTAD